MSVSAVQVALLFVVGAGGGGGSGCGGDGEGSVEGIMIEVGYINHPLVVSTSSVQPPGIKVSNLGTLYPVQP